MNDPDGLRLRFTPTRVGKTPAAEANYQVDAVHPHACGENGLGAGAGDAATGSPPRVWGKRLSARAGDPRRTVHPHACGENATLPATIPSQGGSPPRVWGKPTLPSRIRRAARFTPTRVGKTYTRKRARLAKPVHPHACGENRRETRAGDCRHRFTPTRVGKTLCCGNRLRAGRRFTPTRVGKTRVAMAEALVKAGSPPSVWGKRRPSGLGLGCPGGSPPRVWGKRPQFRPFCRRRGGSPPRVWGKPRSPSPTRGDRSVHPHACGENF